MLEEAIEWMNSWIQTKGLSFSASKSNIMLLTKRRKYIKEKPENYKKDKHGNIIIPGNGVKIDGKPVQWVKEAKYLGLWINDKIKWKTHCDKTIKKAYNIFANCKKVIFKNH